MATSDAPSRVPPYQNARSVPSASSTAVALWTEAALAFGSSCDWKSGLGDASCVAARGGTRRAAGGASKARAYNPANTSRIDARLTHFSRAVTDRSEERRVG